MLLLDFGRCKDLQACKSALRTDGDLDKNKNEAILTASPLDYHAFRQEITSKYPAYNPPMPLVPLEINNNTMLPPLLNHMSPSSSQDNLQALGAINGPSGSIFHQPVHIATPAPSPPPTPGGPGGKGGKKQNYQTNQNFPFLYPPLDSSSNDVGGKGNAELQDRLVGKQWHGSDIPASILEAAQLFHSRMRMSRPLRQLWDVREEFIRYERGWAEHGNAKDSRMANDHDNLGDEKLVNERKDGEENRAESPSGIDSDVPANASKQEEEDPTQGRLDIIETFYVSPHDAQSVFLMLYSEGRFRISSPLSLSYSKSFCPISQC